MPIQFTPAPQVPAVAGPQRDPFSMISAGIGLGEKVSGLYDRYKAKKDIAKLLSKEGEWDEKHYRKIAAHNPELASVLHSIHTEQKEMDRDEQEHFLKFIDYAADYSGRLAHGAMELADPNDRLEFFVEGVQKLVQNEETEGIGRMILKRVMDQHGQPDLSDETLSALIAMARGVELNAKMEMGRARRSGKGGGKGGANEKRTSYERTQQIQAYADKNGISFEQAAVRLHPEEYGFKDESLEGTGAQQTIAGQDYKASDSPPPLPAVGNPANIMSRLNRGGGQPGQPQGPTTVPPGGMSRSMPTAPPPGAVQSQPLPDIPVQGTQRPPLPPDPMSHQQDRGQGALGALQRALDTPARGGRTMPQDPMARQFDRGQVPATPPTGPMGRQPLPPDPMSHQQDRGEIPGLNVPDRIKKPFNEFIRLVKEGRMSDANMVIHRAIFPRSRPVEKAPPKFRAEMRKRNRETAKDVEDTFGNFPDKYRKMVESGEAYIDVYQPYGAGGTLEYWVVGNGKKKLHMLKEVNPYLALGQGG